jgi:hypothetical protein
MRIKLSRSEQSETVEALRQVISRLDRLLELAEESVATFRAPRLQVAGAAKSNRNGRRPARTTRQRKNRRATSPLSEGTSSGVRLPLHDAIEEVLRKANEPLTVSEITRRINDAGLFSMRSGRAVRPSHVTSRISNVRYRDRFHRHGILVGLAPAAGLPSAT